MINFFNYRKNIANPWPPQPYSQYGQDGIIRAIFDAIKKVNKFYVEFGAMNGINFSNTAKLREDHGWTGLLMDIDCIENPEINLYKEKITKENILSLFRKYKVPKNLGFLCIDTDSNDYWFLKEILKEYSPSVIQTEINVNWGVNDSKSIKYDKNQKFGNPYGAYYGASGKAFEKLCNLYGYSVVCFDGFGDLFFVKKSFLPDDMKNMTLDLVLKNQGHSLPMAAHGGLKGGVWIDV